MILVHNSSVPKFDFINQGGRVRVSIPYLKGDDIRDLEITVLKVAQSLNVVMGDWDDDTTCSIEYFLAKWEQEFTKDGRVL